LIAPGFATLATSLMIGWLLIIGGVFGLVAVFMAGPSSPGFWWSLITTILYLLAGIALIWDPIVGTLTLTVILAAYLLATGVTKVAIALGYRRGLPGAWGWMLFSALVD